MISSRHLPNFITAVRIIGAICLLFLEPFSAAFYVVYTISGISDVLDGWVARKMKAVSEFGSKLDSVADLLFYTVMLLKIFPVLWVKLPKKIWLAVGSILIVRLVSYVVAAVRYHQFASTHTYWNKLTGAAVFSVPYVINLPVGGIFCWGICVIAVIAAIYELALHICGKRTGQAAGKAETAV